MPEIIDCASLLETIKHGSKPEYIYFWGHRSKPGRPVGKECLSQWYPASFVIDDQTYLTAEHFMMASKAVVFGDSEAYESVLRAATPQDAASAAEASNFALRSSRQEPKNSPHWTLRRRRKPGFPLSRPMRQSLRISLTVSARYSRRPRLSARLNAPRRRSWTTHRPSRSA